MSLINRHERCIGITLFCWGKYRAEIWYCPIGYSIAPHSHSCEDVSLMYLFGSCEFFRMHMQTQQVDRVKAGWRMFGRCFTVMHFHNHWFNVSKWPLVFINFQKFLPGHKPVSAAVDFKPTYY